AIVDGSRTMALIQVKEGGNGPVSGLFCAISCPAACLPGPVGGRLSTATCSGLPVHRGAAFRYARHGRTHDMGLGPAGTGLAGRGTRHSPTPTTAGHPALWQARSRVTTAASDGRAILVGLRWCAERS